MTKSQQQNNDWQPKQSRHMQHYKPNSELTQDEKKAKRALKKQLKAQQKRIKLETRLRHSMSRKDALVARQTRLALEQLDEKTNDKSTVSDNQCTKNTAARSLVMQIYNELQTKHRDGGQAIQQQKEEQHLQALNLLKHMTKGTQDRSMFSNVDALWGYTRQKFFERAMLVCTSFQKLDPATSEHFNHDNDSSAIDKSICEKAWHCLTKLECICSVGCGPGNDAVGVVAFLESCKIEKTPLLRRVILLDWAISEWKSILNPLCMVLTPRHACTIESHSCDITKSLYTQENEEATTHLQETHCTVDLFLFSYILSEQRGEWESFLSDLVNLAKPEALFYFAEPTPWQLHLLRKRFETELDFCWLDSSMKHPALQPLENRVGPGVLLAIKK